MNSVNYKKRINMGNKANVCFGLIAALATAFALNPNEESFKKYIEAKMER